MFVAFGADQLFMLLLPADSVKRVLLVTVTVSIKSCQGLLKNTFILTQTALLSWQPHPETHSRDLTPRFLYWHFCLFLSCASFTWKTWFSSTFIFYIYCYISSFCSHSSWRMTSTGACTQSLGSFFSPMLPSPSLNGNFSFLSLSKFPGHRKMNLNLREAMYDLMLQQEDLRGLRFIFFDNQLHAQL